MYVSRIQFWPTLEIRYNAYNFHSRLLSACWMCLSKAQEQTKWFPQWKPGASLAYCLPRHFKILAHTLRLAESLQFQHYYMPLLNPIGVHGFTWGQRSFRAERGRCSWRECLRLYLPRLVASERSKFGQFFMPLSPSPLTSWNCWETKNWR
jgi:hypothetical protein